MAARRQDSKRTRTAGRGHLYMKIEKLNDDQIRCTLTMADLAERKIRLHELAYGTEKARTLFRDMMEEAYRKFGFQAENVPIMIEAVPFADDGIVLIISKVDDPEELDTRFSRFTEPQTNEEEKIADMAGADDILDTIHRIYEARKKANGRRRAEEPKEAAGAREDTAPKEPAEKKKGSKAQDVDYVQVFSFSSLDDAIRAAVSLKELYTGNNVLYRMRRTGEYRLVVHQSGHTPEDFNKVCNILSEYGKSVRWSKALEAHFAEHEQRIPGDNALASLSALVKEEG